MREINRERLIPSNKEDDPERRAVALYMDEGPDGPLLLEMLEKRGISVYSCPLSSANEPTFVDPTLISQEGTFRGTEAVHAYIAWFVDDPDYVERYVRGQKRQVK